MEIDKFEKISIGDEAEIAHIISESDVDGFADLTGDTNPLHMDDQFASKTLFRKRVVHGMLSASFISTIIGTKLPGKGALWYELQIRFLAPVRIGEQITVLARVTHKSQSLRVISLDISIIGERQKKVIQGEAKVKMLKQQENKKEKRMIKGAVIISGGCGGIGAAIANSLAEDGYDVVVNYLNSQERAQSIVRKISDKGHKAMAFKADISCYEENENMVKAVMKEFGVLSGIVNNASASLANDDFLDLNWQDIQEHIDVQVKGAFNLSSLALPHFLDQGYGHIVNIGSIATDGTPPLKSTPYLIAKASLGMLTKSLAVEFGPKNIRVNCVAPGMTQTDLIADMPEKSKLVTKTQNPLRRLADPEDIGGAVSFLFSEKAKYINGETIRVCGGQVMT